MATIDPKAFFSITYGLYLLSVRNGDKDNACIINTAMQVTDNPKRISVTINKQNLTAMMLARTGHFAVTALSEKTPFSFFERFGLQSGMNAEKFPSLDGFARTEGGLLYPTASASSVIEAKVFSEVDLGTHVCFFADVTEATVLSAETPMSYAYYFANVKPKPAAPKKTGYVCKICGYVYEGEPLPEDFICPLCKHGASDFEKIN